MRALISNNNELVAVSETIIGGTIEIDGVPYIVHAEDVDAIPENFIRGEYLFEDGNLIKNPDFIEPDTIEKLRADIDYIAMETEVIL